MRLHLLPSAAMLVSEITWVFNAFLFISFAQTDRLMWISYAPWSAAAIALLIWNRRFLRRPRPLFILASGNAILIIMWIVSGWMLFFHVEGIWASLIAVLSIAGTGTRAVILSLKRVTAGEMIRHTELSVMAGGFFFFIQAGPFDVPFAFNIPTLLMLCVDLIALINLRIMKNEDAAQTALPWRNLFLFLALLGLIAVVSLAVLLFLSTPFRLLVTHILSVTGQALLWIYTQLIKILDWLFRPLQQGEVDMPPPPPGMSLPEQEPTEEITVNLLPWIFSLMGVVAAALALWLFIRLFKKRMVIHWQIHGHDGITTFKSGRHPIKRLVALIRTIWLRLKHRILWYRLKYTPAGLFELLQRWGKRHRLPRRTDETPRAFVERLMTSEDWAKQLKGNSEIDDLARRLILHLEQSFYGRTHGNSPTPVLNREQLKRLVSFLGS